MSHKLSAAAAIANADPSTRTHDLIVITLPDPSSPVTLYLATASITVDGQAYAGDIRSMPDVVSSDGGNADSGSFTIQNDTNTYGPVFVTSDRVLDGSTVVITRAFKLANGTWEAVNRDTNPDTGLPYNLPYELGRGVLRTQSVDDETVNCTFISDFSDASRVLGGSMIAQHCLKHFSVGGDGSDPRGGACGWLLAMGGNPASCDHTKSGPNGCDAHGNKRFGGVPPLTPNAVNINANPSSSVLSPVASPATGGYGPLYRRLLELDTDVRLPFVT